MGEASDGGRRKPDWLKKPLPEAGSLRRMEKILRERGLHTVCESALCPNLGECFARGTATFLIMGDVCTRGCRFCGVAKGEPHGLDPLEPERVADAASQLELSHVVVTSVTRDDLADGGAAHFAATVGSVRARLRGASVEVLVPDFGGRPAAVAAVLAARPEVFNHNVETVPRLYAQVRSAARYERSLDVLSQAARAGRSVVKTGLMVGLGETEDEVRAALQGVAGAGVAVVTIGQYLQPSRGQVPVVEYVRPEVFERYRWYGESLGLQVHAGPFVRSSYRAGDSFARACARC